MPRPKKFPDYNADKIQKELIKAVVESYEETGELKITANEFSLSPLKIRKMLITAGVYWNEVSDEVNELYRQGKTVQQIMEITGLKKSSVNGYLPYSKIIYNMHKARAIVYLAIAIANAFISIPLIKLMGPTGAALGTAISLIAGNIIFMNWYYHARIGMNMFYFWKEIAKFIPALIVPIIVGILIMKFANVTGLFKLAFAEKYPLGIEMGRYLAAPCGTYASRVMDIKNNSDTNYIICDGGIHHLKYHGQTMAMQVPEMEVLNTSAETKPYCICGSLCTVADVLVREVELPIVSRNDVILFHRCGAYSVTEGSALFLSRKMPEVYLYNEVTGLEKMRSFVDAADINRKE